MSIFMWGLIYLLIAASFGIITFFACLVALGAYEGDRRRRGLDVIDHVQGSKSEIIKEIQGATKSSIH